MLKTTMIVTGRALLAGVVVALVAGGIAGCNTVKGAGEDVQRIGEGGQRIIDDASR